MHENDNWNEIPRVHNSVIRSFNPITSEDLGIHQTNSNLNTNFSDIEQRIEDFITEMETLHQENERQRKIRSRINLFFTVINCFVLIGKLYLDLKKPEKHENN